MATIEKPINRSPLRQKLGKEYYILKRKWDWLTGDTNYARPEPALQEKHLVRDHRSLILRPLRNVDMYLQENKRTNLELAVDKLHLATLHPGQTFSIWRLVGRPSKAKGYLEGLVLKQGKIATDTGGGLCQLGNLLYWIFAHSPLTITERYRHSFDVFPDVNRKVPFGAGATLAYNYIDLQVRNDTPHTFQIHLWLDETHLNGALFCETEIPVTYRIEERNHIIKQQQWGGYSRHNQIYKVEQHPDGSERESLLVENHALMMYSPLLGASATPVSGQ